MEMIKVEDIEYVKFEQNAVTLLIKVSDLKPEELERLRSSVEPTTTD